MLTVRLVNNAHQLPPEAVMPLMRALAAGEYMIGLADANDVLRWPCRDFSHQTRGDNLVYWYMAPINTDEQGQAHSAAFVSPEIEIYHIYNPPLWIHLENGYALNWGFLFVGPTEAYSENPIDMGIGEIPDRGYCA